MIGNTRGLFSFNRDPEEVAARDSETPLRGRQLPAGSAARRSPFNAHHNSLPIGLWRSTLATTRSPPESADDAVRVLDYQTRQTPLGRG